MKKFHFLFLLTLLLSACANADMDPPRHESSTRSEALSIEDAISIANNAACIFENSARGNHQRECESVSVIRTANSRSSSNDTSLYVVNYANNNGFAIISALPSDDPLLGITDHGNFNSQTYNENANFAFFLDCAVSYANSCADSYSEHMPPAIPMVESKVIKEWSYIEKFGPHIKVEWGQTMRKALFALMEYQVA